jgi:long-chain acyl-CoA synthetase
MIQAVPSASYVSAYLACHYLGAVAVPVAKDAVADSIIWMKSMCEAAGVFLDEAAATAGVTDCGDLRALNAQVFGEAPEIVPPQPHAPADILLTTGTTGGPKGVVLTYCNIKAAIGNVIAGQQLRRDDRVLIPVPINHSFGIRVLRAVLYAGATVVLANGFNSLKSLYGFIHEHACTGMCCVPAAMSLLYQQTRGAIHRLLGSLSYIECCTAPLSRDLKERLLADLPTTRIINSYGSTEAAGVLYIDYRAHPEKLGSVGSPSPGVTVSIVDEACHEIASSPEHPGRLAIGGDVVMSGYWHDEERTQAAVVQGRLMTNDMAYIDPDGYVFLLGRMDDVINVGGKKVSPFEIENAARLFDGLRDCCCIAVEDPAGVLGQVPALFVSFAAPAVSETALHAAALRAAMLREHLGRHLEAYKVPFGIIPLEEIPKNYMGKYERKKLVAIWQETQGGAS